MMHQGQLLHLSAAELERVHAQAVDSPVIRQLVAAEAAASCDAAVFVLTSQARSRCQLAAGIMLGGLFVQAAYLGLIACALCGDRGCPACE